MNNENLYLLKFSWKSIQRHTGRSFFIGLSVSLAVVIAVWVMAFFEGMNSQIEKAVVNTNTGFFQIQDPLYANSTDSTQPRELTSELKNKIGMEPVMALSPELVLDGNIVTPEGAAGLLVLGIDPKMHDSLLPLKSNLYDGEFINSSELNGVVIGYELAQFFKYKVGDQLVLNYQDVNGELRSEILTVKGIYKYNSKGFEKRFIYINQKTWQTLFLNQDSGKALFNRLTLLTPSLASEEVLRQRIANTDLKLKTWKNLNPEMAVVLDFHDGMIKFFFLIIGVTITMTILTPVRMLWQERLKELKMMNTIGVSFSKFWKIGINEALIMIILSGIFSTLFLLVIIGYQSKFGVDFRFLSEGVSIERAGIKLPGIIYPLLSLNQILITFIFILIVFGFSYLWSIHRTLKKLEVEG